MRLRPRRTTLSSKQGRLEITAEGGANRRSAKNADAPSGALRGIDASARPLHSPEGAMHSLALTMRHQGRSQGNRRS
jgi:hypothetical protein